MDKKSTDAELMKASPDFHKCTGVDFNFVKYVVASRWNRGNGKQEEAIECFKLFNKRNHETITASDIKSTMMEFLEFNLTDQDMNDFMSVIDKDNTGMIDFKRFQALYNNA